jgi:hypothetical protein
LTVTGLVTAGSAAITGDLTAGGNSVIGTGSTQNAAANRGNLTIGGTAGAILNLSIGSADTGYIQHDAIDIYFSNRIAAGSLFFQTNSTTRYRIASDGVATWSNVGGVAGTAMTLNSTGLAVGTASATYKLDLLATGACQSRIKSTGNGQTAGLRIESKNSDGTDCQLLIGSGVVADNEYNIRDTLNTKSLYRISGISASSNAHNWFTGAATASMILDASGNLLVGRTTLFAQASRLTIESNSQTTSICGIFNDSRTDATSAINIAFYRNGTKVGSVDCTNAATSYVTSSDYRLKDDVQPLSGGLSRVCALKPSIYKWKINGFNGEGFIAHELAEVVPFAVTGEKDAVNKDGSVNPQGVDLSKVVPILVAAIKELTARVQTLEAK